MEDNDKQFIAGFNSGYLLQKHEPELFEKISKVSNDNNQYCLGLTAGGKQFDKDKKMELLKEEKNQNKSKTQDKDIDRDR